MGQSSVIVRTVSGNEPRFDLSLKKGRRGELQIGAFLDWIFNDDEGHVEVKTKSYVDLELYVEQEHDRGCAGRYVPSGISTTDAALWCFVIAETGMHIGIPTNLLREAIAWPSSRPSECQVGSCPTRGVLVNFGMLLRRVKQQRDHDKASRPESKPRDPDPVSQLTATDIRWSS